MSIDQVILEEAPLPESLEKKRSARSNNNTGGALLSMQKQKSNFNIDNNISSHRQPLAEPHSQLLVPQKPTPKRARETTRSNVNKSLDPTVSRGEISGIEAPETEAEITKTIKKTQTPSKILLQQYATSSGRPSTGKFLTQ